MARPKKNTVDYFPHQAVHGKTLFIIQNLYGNDGYAFWFKLLEILCRSENLVLEVNMPAEMLFLSAKTHTEPQLCEKILKTLADLGGIDAELWEKRIIWSEKLVKNVEQVFLRRGGGVPQRPVVSDKNPVFAGNNPVNDVGNSQIKLNEIKVNKSIHTYTGARPQDIVEAYHRICTDLPTVKILSDARKAFLKSRGEHLKTLDEWVLFWSRVHASDFLCGRKTDKDGHSWRADFEWCIRPSNFIKILEGNYDNRTGQKKRSGLDEWAAEQGLLPTGHEDSRNALPKPELDEGPSDDDV
jgi:hypothetical protein